MQQPVPVKLHNKPDIPVKTASGEVPDGKVRAEVLKNCWASNNKRLFKGDVVDLSVEDFEGLSDRQFVRQQWIKPNPTQAPKK